MEIKTKTIAQAHAAVCREIFEECEEVITEDGELTFEYPEPILIIIEKPFENSRVSSFCGFGENALDKYTHDLLNGCDNDFVYNYHDRLFVYKSILDNDDIEWDEDICGEQYYYKTFTNQIACIIQKLEKEPESRRAQAITWYPEVDINSDNPPCLQRIQCLIRNGKLNMHVEFRSNDCLSAFGQNVYALTVLQKLIADELGLPVGIYSHGITSAHIYFKRDAEELKKLKMEIYK